MLPVLYNNLKRIVQTDSHVMILTEMVHDARVIRLNAQHRPSHMRTWMGDSIGHWEGDTLVVDTINFVSNPALGGADENLRVIERFKKERMDHFFTVFALRILRYGLRRGRETSLGHEPTIRSTNMPAMKAIMR